jgi:hypothetical protein
MYTWGQVRMQLQMAAPGVSLDLIDSSLNSRYEQILNYHEWEGLHAHTTVETQAAYQSGTDSVTPTVGSTAITGSGTAWTSALVGQRFLVVGDTEFYTITAVGSATSLTIDRAYEGDADQAAGTTLPGSAYILFQHIYALPSDCKYIESVENPITGYPLQFLAKEQFDISVGPRNYVDDPGVCTAYDDTSENSPPVSHQIEFFPPPLYERGYKVRYQRAANGWDGLNTGGSPLPFVEMSALLHGGKADIYAFLAANGNGSAAVLAKYHEGKFAESLARMVKVDMKRQPYPVAQMADRFVRHRLARVQRGYNRMWGPGQGGPN